MTDFDLATLREAVLKKYAVAFMYEGLIREVCPTLLGETAKGLVLQGFQYAGKTSAGEIRVPEAGGWKYFYLDKVGQVLVRGGAWYPEPVLDKAEKREYVLPKFIVRVLAMTPKEQNESQGRRDPVV